MVVLDDWILRNPTPDTRTYITVFVCLNPEDSDEKISKTLKLLPYFIE